MQKKTFKSMRDLVRQKAQEREKEKAGVGKFDFSEYSDRDVPEMFQPRKGIVRLDILPYLVSVPHNADNVPEGELWYRRKIWVHYNVGVENKTYVCPRTIGKACPIFEYYQDAVKKDKNAWNDPAIKDLKAKEREVYNVIDLDDADKGIQLFESSYHLFGKKLEEELLEGDVDNDGFALLEGGKTLKIRFSEEKFQQNTFFDTTRIDFEDRDDYDEAVLDDVFDLDIIVKVPTYDQLESLFLGGAEAAEDDEDDRPSRRSSNRTSSGASKYKKQTSSKKKEEEPEEDPEEDEEPEEKKSAKRTTSRRPPVKKEEPEEEDEPEEEPEEEPRSRRTTTKAKPAVASKKKEEEAEESEDECPYGADFGKDCDAAPECEECELWKPCRKAQMALSKKKDEPVKRTRR